MGTIEERIGTLRFTATPEHDHVRVWYGGQVSTIAIAEAWLARVDALLQASGLSRVLWESRDADGHPPDVRDHIWDWLCAARYVKASAIVVNSELLRTSANLSSHSGLRIRAFNAESDALSWLRRQPV